MNHAMPTGSANPYSYDGSEETTLLNNVDPPIYNQPKDTYDNVQANGQSDEIKAPHKTIKESYKAVLSFIRIYLTVDLVVETIGNLY